MPPQCSLPRSRRIAPTVPHTAPALYVRSYVSVDKPFTILEDDMIQSFIELVKKPEEAPAEAPAAEAPVEAMETEG